jgi:hypothetical protein
MITLRINLPRYLALGIALAAAAPAFGFGGHPFPPSPPVTQPNPEPPGNGSPTPPPDTGLIPPALLQPTLNDFLPPTFTDGGDSNPTPPPDSGTPNSTPEPATLAMGLLGAGIVGAWMRRRRRSN